MKWNKKEARDTFCAIFILATVFITGYAIGESSGFNKGIEVNHGDEWDCAYSYSTGFLMCDRKPKYK